MSRIIHFSSGVIQSQHFSTELFEISINDIADCFLMPRILLIWSPDKVPLRDTLDKDRMREKSGCPDSTLNFKDLLKYLTSRTLRTMIVLLRITVLFPRYYGHIVIFIGDAIIGILFVRLVTSLRVRYINVEKSTEESFGILSI